MDEAGSVFGGRLSQINFVKHRINSAAKSVHGLNICELAHAQVLVNKITKYSICKLVNGSGVFLVRGEANLTGAIELGTEVIIICPHAMKNIQKQNFLDIRYRRRNVFAS
jgi:hypothetical protein